MKGAIISFLKGVGESVVKTVKFVQGKGKKGVKKMKDCAGKIVSTAKRNTGFMSPSEKKDLYYEGYKRDASGLDKQEADRIRQEDHDRFIEDMNEIEGIKRGMVRGIVGSMMAGIAIAAFTAIVGGIKVSSIIEKSVIETVAWNGAYR